MREWLKRYNIIILLVSVISSVTLWVIALDNDNPPRELVFNNIPIVLDGRDQLSEALSLVPRSDNQSVISVRIRAPHKTLMRVESGNISVRCDVSKLTEPGEYDLAYTISTNISGTEALLPDDASLHLVFERQVTVEKPVTLNVTGTLPENVSVGAWLAEPASVKLSGYESELSKVNSVQVTVDADDIQDNSPVAYEYDLIADDEGGVLVSDLILKETPAVNLTIPLELTKEVYLRALCKTSSGITTDSNYQVSVSPDTTLIIGPVDTVEGMHSITLQTIDFSTVPGVDGMVKDIRIPLPEGVRFVDENKDTAKVRLTFKDIEMKNFKVTDIRLENIPTGYIVTLVNDSIDVTVRGASNVFDSLTERSLFATVDAGIIPILGDSALVNGIYEIPVRINRSSTPYTPLDILGMYYIAVEVTKP